MSQVCRTKLFLICGKLSRFIIWDQNLLRNRFLCINIPYHSFTLKKIATVWVKTFGPHCTIAFQHRYKCRTETGIIHTPVSSYSGESLWKYFPSFPRALKCSISSLCTLDLVTWSLSITTHAINQSMASKQWKFKMSEVTNTPSTKNTSSKSWKINSFTKQKQMYISTKGGLERRWCWWVVEVNLWQVYQIVK